jgi:hypothetical protein
VAQPGFNGVDVGRPLEVMVPICSEAIIRGANSQLDQRSRWWMRVLGRPKPGVSPRQVMARLRTLAPDILAATVPQRWRAGR